MPAPDEPAVDAALAANVAHLARLGLSDDERRAAAAQLAGILGHFRALQAVDTAGVAPLVHTLAVPGAPAADNVVPFADARARLLGLASHVREGFLVVPRILDADFGPEEPAAHADPDPADEESPG